MKLRRSGIFALTAVTICSVAMWVAAQDYEDGRDRDGYREGRSEGLQDRDHEAYRAGMEQGRMDARRGVRPIANSRGWDEGWRSDRDRRIFNAGYDHGYDEVMAQQRDWSNRGAYQQGLREGQWDAQHGRSFSPRDNRWGDYVDQRAFLAGYNRGYHDAQASGFGISIPGLQLFFQGGRDRDRDRDESRDYRQSGQYASNQNGQRNYNQPNGGAVSLNVQGNNVSWQSPVPNARIFLQEDNQPERLFASGTSGSQAASWMLPGHTYTFIMRDQGGNELTRQQVRRAQ